MWHLFFFFPFDFPRALQTLFHLVTNVHHRLIEVKTFRAQPGDMPCLCPIMLQDHVCKPKSIRITAYTSCHAIKQAPSRGYAAFALCLEYHWDKPEKQPVLQKHQLLMLGWDKHLHIFYLASNKEFMKNIRF